MPREDKLWNFGLGVKGGFLEGEAFKLEGV